MTRLTRSSPRRRAPLRHHGSSAAGRYTGRAHTPGGKHSASARPSASEAPLRYKWRRGRGGSLTRIRRLFVAASPRCLRALPSQSRLMPAPIARCRPLSAARSPAARLLTLGNHAKPSGPAWSMEARRAGRLGPRLTLIYPRSLLTPTGRVSSYAVAPAAPAVPGHSRSDLSLSRSVQARPSAGPSPCGSAPPGSAPRPRGLRPALANLAGGPSAAN
jgi:hypothetical protein